MLDIEAQPPGKLLNQNTFYWGTLNAVGEIHVQIAVDVLCSLAFAEVYMWKMPITAANGLDDRVRPFYQALG